jgi:cysteinyl-tRNA synthetase
MLKLYNTLTRTKEEFRPINPGKVGIYVCGPTVYDYVHLGNIRSYTTPDIIKRYLEYLGYEVRLIKNITDVGHLTEDDIAQGDSGEDKIAKKAILEKKTPAEIASFYEEDFREIENRMNILPAQYFPHATAHIPQMIKIITDLIEKGFAYEKNGNVFFSVTKFPDYGKLSGNTLENLKVGARLEEHPDKENPWDFALWLKAPKEHLLKWESPWSLGYPGWHIECSAMSTEYLGDTIDIHTGGEDNIFPHHEAEIAQTECATGKKYVNYWIHTRHLKVDGVKMSKSKGNFYRLKDIEDKGYSPMALRLLLLSAHRQTQLNFTWKAMDQAKSNLQKINDFILNMEALSTAEDSESNFEITPYREKFESAMNDDINTPLALSVLFEIITDANKLITKSSLSAKDAKNILAFWKKINSVFGLTLYGQVEIPQELIDLAEKRKKAKLEKDFKKSDMIRKEIENLGYTIEDLKDEVNSEGREGALGHNNYLIKKQ